MRPTFCRTLRPVAGRMCAHQSLCEPQGCTFFNCTFPGHASCPDRCLLRRRPCTRGQSGSAAVVSYVDLDRGMPTSGSDSGGASGAEAAFNVAPHGREKKKVGRPITYKGALHMP